MATVDSVCDLASSNAGKPAGMRKRAIKRVISIIGAAGTPARHLSGILSLNPWLLTHLNIDAIDGLDDDANRDLVSKAKQLIASR